VASARELVDLGCPIQYLIAFRVNIEINSAHPKLRNVPMMIGPAGHFGFNTRPVKSGNS
jgi:hypothetical protein